MPQSLLIYTPRNTPRLLYTLQWMLEERLGLTYSITSEKAFYEDYSGPQICYDAEPATKGIHIPASGLLAENGIREQNLNPGEWMGFPVLFSTTSGEIPFDVLSGVFYLLSRYEEYVYSGTDAHGRFLHTQSILHRCNALQMPLVDLWLKHFGRILQQHYPELELKKEDFRYLPTFDIDQAFAYKEKGLLRNTGGLFREILKGEWGNAGTRIRVLSHRAKDPYDTFDTLLALQQEYSYDTLAFILLGDYGTHDKNIDFKNAEFKKRILMLQEKMAVGIHPSYPTATDGTRIKKEVKRLVDILFQPVSMSRQHYLRFTLPQTYALLLEAGIRHDYSMGYSPVTGFRAGTSHAFLWYNLAKEETTALNVHPVCAMDVTLKNAMQQTPGQATDTLYALLQQVKEVNGTFISIWHNESISEYGEWQGWKPVFETLTRQAMSNV